MIVDNNVLQTNTKFTLITENKTKIPYKTKR